MILTAEADSLSTDAKELLNDYGLVGCDSSKSNDLSVHARNNSSGYIRLLLESDDDNRYGHEAIFEVKFGKKTERTTTESRERSAEQLFADPEPVESAVAGSDLGTTEDPFVPTASCINHTKKRRLVTRSGLPRLRCCVCHLHHKWAMNSPAAVRELFKMLLQQVYHFKVDVIAGIAVMLREMQREVNMRHQFECRLHIDYSTNNHSTQLHAANDFDCCFMAILSW